MKSISQVPLRTWTVISGANGFIASYLIRALLTLNESNQLGLHVRGLVRSHRRAEHCFGSLLERPDFDICIGDVTQPLDESIPADWVIHAASQTAPGQFRQVPVETILTNVLGTRNLLEYARSQKARGFLLLSTREVYGAAIRDFVSEEYYGGLDPAVVRSCYPESKRLAESLVIAYGSQYGLKGRIVRLDHCYGPGMVLEDGRVVGDFIGDAVAGRSITLNSDGSSILALTYISDAICGILQTMTAFPDTVYNIANSEEPVSVKELAGIIASLCDEQECSVIQKRCSDEESKGYCNYRIGLLSSQKARQAGWEIHIPLRTGLERTLCYYRDIRRGD